MKTRKPSKPSAKMSKMGKPPKGVEPMDIADRVAPAVMKPLPGKMLDAMDGGPPMKRMDRKKR